MPVNNCSLYVLARCNQHACALHRKQGSQQDVLDQRSIGLIRQETITDKRPVLRLSARPMYSNTLVSRFGLFLF